MYWYVVVREECRGAFGVGKRVELCELFMTEKQARHGMG